LYSIITKALDSLSNVRVLFSNHEVQIQILQNQVQIDRAGLLQLTAGFHSLMEKYLTEALRLIDQSKDGNLFGYEKARIFLNKAAREQTAKI
jgi:hypothetical protein